jgi:predicted transcription factor, homolog of eukaryotic MBF1
LSDYFGLTLDELVKDIDVQEVRDKNISNEKINSIYNDVNTAKTFVKWYLIIAGIAAGIVLILFAYFIINSLFVW